MMRSALFRLRAMPALRPQAAPQFAAATVQARSYALKLPKRPTSAYNLFVKANIAKGVQHGDTKSQDAMRTLAQEWGEMPAWEKTPFEDQAAVEKAKHAAGKAALAAGQTLPPKKPISSFLRYLTEHKPEGGRAAVSEGGAAWRNFTDAEKEPYRRGYMLASEEYLADINAWEATVGEARLEKIRSIEKEFPKMTPTSIYKALGKKNPDWDRKVLFGDVQDEDLIAKCTKLAKSTNKKHLKARIKSFEEFNLLQFIKLPVKL